MSRDVKWKGIDIDSAYDDSYNEYLQLAHRRPTFQQNAPTLSWHVALWRDDSDQHQNDVTAERYEQARKDWIETKLNPLLRTLQTRFPSTHGDGEDGMRAEAQIAEFRHKPARHSRQTGGRESTHVEVNNGAAITKDGIRLVVWPYSVNFPLRWQDIELRCVASYSSDFFTFTFLVDFERSGGAARGDPQLQRLVNALELATGRVSAGYDDAKAHGFRQGVPWRDKKPSEAEAEAAALLFANFWAGFADALKHALGRAAGETLFPGRIFADFRAVVLRIDPQWKRSLPGAAPEEEIEAERRDLGVAHRRFSDLEARWVLSAAWPFFKASSPGENAVRKRKDSVACLFLKRKAIYLSSLGVQEDIDFPARILKTAGEGPDATTTEKNPPVCFLLFLKGRPNRRQLGRLIERINYLGTLRLAALRDFNTFREISVDVRHYGARLDAISAALTESLSVNAKHTAPDKEGLDTRAIEAGIIQLAEDINTSTSKIPGGLHYRAARTRIMVNSFKQRVEDLRIDRIEFWQPYDEFVRRTLFEMYDFMISVDERVFALRNRLRQVLTGIQTSALVQLTSGIRDLNEEANGLSRGIAKLNEEAVRLTEGILEIDRETETLQKILYVVAVSAFFGELVEAVLRSTPTIVTSIPVLAEVWNEISGGVSLESDQAKENLDKVGSLGKVAGYIGGVFVALASFPLFQRLFRRGRKEARAAE